MSKNEWTNDECHKMTDALLEKAGIQFVSDEEATSILQERIVELEAMTTQQSVQLSNQSAQLIIKDTELTDVKQYDREARTAFQALRKQINTERQEHSLCPDVIAGMVERIAALEIDIQAYRGVLGYPVPGDHNGFLSNGTLPTNGITDALNKRISDLECHAAQCVECGAWTCGFCGMRNDTGEWRCEICHYGQHVCHATELLTAKDAELDREECDVAVKSERSPEITCMDIYSPPGTRVRFAHPTNGYLIDQETAAKHLVVGEVYTVDHADVYSSSTTVYLVGYPDVGFNSVMFEEVPDVEPRPIANSSQGKQLVERDRTIAIMKHHDTEQGKRLVERDRTIVELEAKIIAAEERCRYLKTKLPGDIDYNFMYADLQGENKRLEYQLAAKDKVIDGSKLVYDKTTCSILPKWAKELLNDLHAKLLASRQEHSLCADVRHGLMEEVTKTSRLLQDDHIRQQERLAWSDRTIVRLLDRVAELKELLTAAYRLVGSSTYLQAEQLFERIAATLKEKNNG